jgi:hypothetical protein
MVTASQTLKMYELLNKHFKNSEDAKVLVAGIEEVIDGKFEAERDRLATKSDLFLAKSDLHNAVNEVRKEINRVETRMEQGFKDQLKWLIVLMVGLSSLAVAVMKLT